MMTPERHWSWLLNGLRGVIQIIETVVYIDTPTKQQRDQLAADADRLSHIVEELDRQATERETRNILGGS